MVNKKKIKSLAVYIAVVLLLFAFLVPVLQDKIRQNTKPDHPENLTATPVGEINGEELAASSASSDTPASSQELEPDLNTIIWPLEGQVIRGVDFLMLRLSVIIATMMVSIFKPLVVRR